MIPNEEIRDMYCELDKYHFFKWCSENKITYKRLLKINGEDLAQEYDSFCYENCLNIK